MEPTIQDIQELRAKFLQKVQDENKDFHQKDLNRVNNDDSWLRRFLIHHDLEIKDALNMLIETCEWRKSFKVNEISEQTVNREYLEEGSIFVHSRDKDGKSLFIFRCCKHVKGQKDFEELKKCVVYWMERVERHDKGDQITIFFDMTDTGLANMDMDYTKYLINLCKQYYPHFLNYILIFEMPWVLNAAFKIIKTWLPTKAVQKIKFVNKNTLKDYVDSAHALKSWGGLDNFEFSFHSESSGEYSKTEENKKKVHFADGSPAVESHPGDWDSFNADDKLSSTRVLISPQDAISFTQEGIEITGTFTVQNISNVNISYKVKTTSPEKFRVRPSCGMLSADDKVTISIVLLTGYTGANILRDKFLVMNIPLDHAEYSASDLTESWRKVDNTTVEEHRLRCRVGSLQVMSHNGAPGVGLSSGLSASPSTELEQKISQLLISMNHVSESCFKVENEVKSQRRILFFVTFLVVCLALCLTYVVQDMSAGKMDHCLVNRNSPSL
uniref:Putative phosphatidylinositol transfer protein pdr16 n=1 Tax=Panstrongylus lignarius TaxID=156445 RepID=A0A224XF82_9HEMI